MCHIVLFSSQTDQLYYCIDSLRSLFRTNPHRMNNFNIVLFRKNDNWHLTQWLVLMPKLKLSVSCKMAKERWNSIWYSFHSSYSYNYQIWEFHLMWNSQGVRRQQWRVDSVISRFLIVYNGDNMTSVYSYLRNMRALFFMPSSFLYPICHSGEIQIKKPYSDEECCICLVYHNFS